MEVDVNFYVFESQCLKIMVLSKALKAKLSLIPSEVTSLSKPDPKRRTVGPSFDHLPWR